MRRRELLRALPAVPAFALAGGASSCAHDTMTYATNPQRPSKDGVVHVGNSTHLIVLEGVHVLTDPWLKDPADKVLNHRVPPAPLPTDIDVLLLTHEHEDHFDEAALALINKSCAVVVPVWLAERTRALGFTDVRAVRPGDVLADVRGLAVEVARARHDVDEVVYRFTCNGRRVFFGGDTLPTTEIDSLAQKDTADTAPISGGGKSSGADFCILPADGGALMGTRHVMNVDEAVAMAQRFGVDQAGKGALLTHHEFELTSSLWRLILDVKPVDTARLPAWFQAPVPGQHIKFPWQS